MKVKGGSPWFFRACNLSLLHLNFRMLAEELSVGKSNSGEGEGGLTRSVPQSSVQLTSGRLGKVATSQSSVRGHMCRLTKAPKGLGLLIVSVHSTSSTDALSVLG